MAVETQAVTKGLLVTLLAKEGREHEVEQLLEQGRSLVDGEPDTTAWFAFRAGPRTFGIFDVFPDEGGREAHLSGQVAAALIEKADELFEEQPAIVPLDVTASKLPT